MEEKNLFSGISLTGDFEIPDVSPQQVEEVVQEKEESNTKKAKDVEEVFDDLSFEIPDTVKEVEVEKKEPTETTKDTSKVGENTDKKSGNSSSSPFLLFAKALVDDGVLTTFEETDYEALVKETGSEAEALIELNKRTIQAEIDSYKEESEAEYKAFLEARDAGVNLNDWAVVQDNKKRFSKITDEDLDTNEKLQKQLITEDLKRRKFEDADILDTIESYEDTNKLASMSKKALKNLTKAEEEKEEALKTSAIENEKQAAKAAKQQVEDLKKEITKVDEIIPGLKLNKQVKDKILQNIMTPVKTLDDGRQLNAVMLKRSDDPIKYAILEAYFVEQGFFDGKFDKFVAKAKTNAVKDLESKITGDTSYHTGKTALNATPEEIDKEYELGWKNVGKR